MHEITGNIVDIHNRRTFPGRVRISPGHGGRIVAVEETDGSYGNYLLPGFVDAHVHVESSMLTPGNFAASCVVHGTVATVSDPHEIANVLGVDGVKFMLDDAGAVPFKFCFGAPSCVPATAFETAGASIDVAQTRELLADPRIGYLSEMMNWPGVLARDEQVMAKIAAAHELGKTVDGHAPGLRGEQAKRYHDAGIATDHECFTLDEAKDKLAAGANILIREGSAARNLEALWTLIDAHPGRVMLCSDDKHPNDLVHGHVNELCARLIAKGCDLYNVLRAACVVPVEHYRLPVGLLRAGEPTDLIEVDDLTHFKVLRTWIGGELVAQSGKCNFHPLRAEAVNRFDCKPVTAAALGVPCAAGKLRVIVADDGEIVTRGETCESKVIDGNVVADPARDVLKIVVLNRYRPAPPAVAFIRGFGLERGAIAGSVAHDSHNILAVGTNDADLAAAINAVIAERGGLSVVDGTQTHVLPLPIAGLMSPDKCGVVAETYETLEARARALGSTLRSPFMTLSFMALLVIPQLKLSDLGLFDGQTFTFAPLFDQ